MTTLAMNQCHAGPRFAARIAAEPAGCVVPTRAALNETFPTHSRPGNRGLLILLNIFAQGPRHASGVSMPAPAASAV